MIYRHLIVILFVLFTANGSLAGRKRALFLWPARDESSPGKCLRREYHVICGPERHCERTCDNLFAPPYCEENHTNPKCFFPRCLCIAGFVRSGRGKCIKPRHCPSNTLEQAMNRRMTSDSAFEGSGAPSLQSSLVARNRLTRHDLLHQRRARHFMHRKHAKDESPYFW